MRDRKAVAVQYDATLPAPVITSKGRRELAEALEEIARAHGVEIVRSSELAESLIELEIGSFIPEAFYGIMAEILVFVRKLKEDA